MPSTQTQSCEAPDIDSGAIDRVIEAFRLARDCIVCKACLKHFQRPEAWADLVPIRCGCLARVGLQDVTGQALHCCLSTSRAELSEQL